MCYPNSLLFRSLMISTVLKVDQNLNPYVTHAFPGYLESTFKWGPCVHDTELKPGTPSTRMVRITQKQGSVKHERGVHCRTPTRGHHSTIVAVFLLCRHKLFVVLFSYTDPRVIKCCPTQHHLRG